MGKGIKYVVMKIKIFDNDTYELIEPGRFDAVNLLDVATYLSDLGHIYLERYRKNGKIRRKKSI